MSLTIEVFPDNDHKITVTDLVDCVGDPVIDADVTLIVTEVDGTEIANENAAYNASNDTYEGVLPASTPLVVGTDYIFELSAVSPSAGTGLWSEKIKMRRRKC